MNKNTSSSIVASVLAAIVVSIVVGFTMYFTSPKAEPQAAALSGPDISSPYICYGSGSARCTHMTGISCNTASSTVFGVANPWGNATSTVELVNFSGVGNATTTSLKVGTSTAPTGAPSTVYAILASVSIPTSTPFIIGGGMLYGPGNGVFISSGSGTANKIMVKPGESVVGYASTTATGAGAVAFSGGYTSCSGTLLWTRL